MQSDANLPRMQQGSFPGKVSAVAGRSYKVSVMAGAMPMERTNNREAWE